MMRASCTLLIDKQGDRVTNGTLIAEGTTVWGHTEYGEIFIQIHPDSSLVRRPAAEYGLSVVEQLL